MYIFIVCSMLFGNDNIQIELARLNTLNLNYQKSNEILHTINVIPSNYNNYHYYNAINWFKLNDKIKAEWHLQQLEKSFEPITTRRQQVIIQLMLDDIQNWKKDDLKDIVRDMQISKDKLEISKVDTRTKQAQADIITKLDRLIKEKEDSKNKSIQSVNSNSNPSKPSTPQSDSQQATTQGKGISPEKSLQNYEKIWGTLPEKERKRIILQITNDLPAKYKAEIELYFKSLNKYVKE